MDSALEEKSGYIKKSSVVGFAKAAGFELVDKSSVNANPKDSHDWPEGVWTLPPTLQKGDVDREKYQAIGESDRMTRKFRKPLRSDENTSELQSLMSTSYPVFSLKKKTSIK